MPSSTNTSAEVPRRFDAQNKCIGVMYYTMAMKAEGKQPICAGISKTVDYEDLVDLHEHHESRGLDHGVPVKQIACLGTTSYYVKDPMGGNVAPPCCEGIEFLKYGLTPISTSSAYSSSTTQNGNSPAAPVNTHITADYKFPKSNIIASSVSEDASAAINLPSSPRQTPPAAVNESHSLRNNPNNTSTKKTNSNASSIFNDEPSEEVPRALTFTEAWQKYSEIASQADPLWFARAFCNRAAVNVEHMSNFVQKAFGRSKE